MKLGLVVDLTKVDDGRYAVCARLCCVRPDSPTLTIPPPFLSANGRCAPAPTKRFYRAAEFKDHGVREVVKIRCVG